MIQTSLTTDVAHLRAGGIPIRFVSADEAAYYRSRAEVLRAEAIDAWIGAGARGIARLFRFAPVLPNRSRGGKLVAAE